MLQKRGKKNKYSSILKTNNFISVWAFIDQNPFPHPFPRPPLPTVFCASSNPQKRSKALRTVRLQILPLPRALTSCQTGPVSPVSDPDPSKVNTSAFRLMSWILLATSLFDGCFSRSWNIPVNYSMNFANSHFSISGGRIALRTCRPSYPEWATHANQWHWSLLTFFFAFMLLSVTFTLSIIRLLVFIVNSASVWL